MKKFGVRDQVGYMFGDVGGSFVNLFVDSYFMMFCTYVLGISPFFMGTMFLFARLWDAVNDPIIGSFPDRWTIGKSGDKFKPYIKIFMIPLAISGILCFMNVSSWGDLAKHIWVCFAYILYGMCYTGTSMPYGSLASVISPDPVERTKLSRARSIGGMIVGIGALSVVPQVVFDADNNVKGNSFVLLALIFGACSLISYLLLLNNTVERVKLPRSKEKFNYLRVLKGVFKNRPLIGAMIATMGSLIAITGQSQFGSYLYKEYYRAPKVLTAVSLASLPITIILFPLIPPLAKKVGKRKLLLWTGILSLVFSVFLFIVPIPNVWLYFALSLVATFGNSIFAMLVWALVTDCIDYQEYVTGERNDGSVYSIFTFARKLGSTIASTVASYALGWIGFVSGAAQQSDAVAKNIRMLCTAIPVVTAALIVVGIGLVFNLTQEDTEKISGELAERHAKLTGEGAKA